jgi:hypothetical protein
MGWNDYGSVKPSSTQNFSGVNSSEQTNPNCQTGGFNGGAPFAGINPNASTFPDMEMLQSVPAQTNVTVSGENVIQVGAPNQFRCQASLASESLQLAGHVNTATNVNSDPPLGTFVWISRNANVATVDADGLVTFVGRGECDIECRYSRAANLPFTNASPSQTESMAVYATVALVVTP